MHRVVCCFAGYDALIARQIADALDGRTRGSVPDTWVRVQQAGAAGERETRLKKSRQKNGAFKKFEERPDIMASERFLARIDEGADRQTTAAVSWGRDNAQEISRLLTAGGRNGGRAGRAVIQGTNLSTESDQAHRIFAAC
jgi:hypothetical protein